jgi:integrase
VKAVWGPLSPHLTLTELRDRALFFTLLATGARIFEVLQMRRDQLEDAWITQKGGRPKRLTFPPAVRQIIEDYLEARTDQEPWLWMTTEAGVPARRMSPAAALKSWDRLAKRARVQPWTSHQLRHTCATELKRARVPDLVIAEHLGHANLSTLQNYVQVIDEQRAEKLIVLEGLVDFPRPRLPVRVKGRPDNRPRPSQAAR